MYTHRSCDAGKGEMSMRHAGWLDRDDTEYLPSAGYAGLRHDRRLARLLVASAPAGPHELAGEQASIAASGAAVVRPDGWRRSTPRPLHGSARCAEGSGQHG